MPLEAAATDPWLDALVGAIRGDPRGTASAVEFAALLRRHGVSEPEVAAAASGTTRERFGLYRSLVGERLRGALAASLPLTLARLGPERTAADVAEFIERCGPRSRYLREVAVEFVTFIAPSWAADPRLPEHLPQLAAHELLLLEVGAAPDDPPAAGGTITPESRLRIQRAARLRHYDHAVHRLVGAGAGTMPSPGRVAVLVYRDGAGFVRCLELSRLAAALLAELTTRSSPLATAVRAACERTATPLCDTVLAELATLLDELHERGVIRGAE